MLSLRLILNPKSTDWHPLVCNKQVKRNGKLASAMMAKKSSINFERRRIFFKIRNPFFFCVCQNWVKKSSQRLIYGCHLGFQEEVFADAAMLMCKVVWLIPQHKVYCTCNLVMYSISILFWLFAFKSVKINNLLCNLEELAVSTHSKGQLISKAKFKVFIWTKNWTKIFFFYFCPSF